MSADGQKTERVHLLISSAELEEVDSWGFSQHIRSRSEAIRRLIVKGLEAWKAEGKSGNEASA